eukprot:479322-Karenia_brevis.AAC.1
MEDMRDKVQAAKTQMGSHKMLGLWGAILTSNVSNVVKQAIQPSHAQTRGWEKERGLSKGKQRAMA